LDLIGLHMHIGAQLTDAAQYRAGVRSLVTTALTQADTTGHRVGYLNMGGGLPVAYHTPDGGAGIADQTSTMLKAGRTPQNIAQDVFEVLESISGADVFTKLILEPGSRVIADTGVLLSTVENVKSRPNGDHWLLLDAGFNTLMDILGYNWYFHALAAGKIDQDAAYAYKLGGPLCDSGDVYHDSEGYGRLPDYRSLPAGIQPDDVIAFLDVGGYTLEQMNQYNGQPRAAAVLIRRDGQVQLIRRRETYADLLAHDLDLSD
jgi:diaminopimelate decarboxylase